MKTFVSDIMGSNRPGAVSIGRGVQFSSEILD